MYSDAPADPSEYVPGVRRQLSPVGDLAGQLEDLRQAVEDSGLHYQPWHIAAFVTACRTKPFVILAGISGTGKTRLPERIAQITGAEFDLCPVKPDWTDSADLLGFENLQSQFRPGRFLVTAESAAEDAGRHYFFCLDEMNLARVEYYFAEVLSVLEQRHWLASSNELSSPPLTEGAPTVDDVDWGEVSFPSNLCIIGTVNMDESTHDFARKVLDRSFVLELSDVDLSIIHENVGFSPIDWPARNWLQLSLALSDDDRRESPLVDETIADLVEINSLLEPAQLQFGYRLRDEVVLFVLNAQDMLSGFRTSGGDTVHPFDVACMSKILPRVSGGGARIEDALRGLLDFLQGHGASSDEDDEEDDVRFPLSYNRVQIMLERLEHDGFTSFWL